MRVLFVASEVAPFSKVGGLADVVGSLPIALTRRGLDVRLLSPLYRSVHRSEGWIGYDLPMRVKVDREDRFARVWESTLADQRTCCHFLEHNELFDRDGIYDGPWGPHTDNDRRAAFLSRAAIDYAAWSGWTPDLIHCHDWATALVPVWLNTTDRDSDLGRVATVLTIHNLEHQGYSHRSLMNYARLPESEFRADSLEAMGAVNLLKGGVYHATKVTTVSPSYAREIQNWPGGCGLEPVLKFRAADLIGVLNGIDTQVWDPRRDPRLPANYGPDDLSGKMVCQDALRTRFGLLPAGSGSLFGVVSRLFAQKGLDLLATAIPWLMNSTDAQVVVLGAGDPGLEHGFRDLAGRFPGRVGVQIGFHEDLAHLIYAGSDFFLMPSRFEPCGLGQLYSMRYGTPPLARATGGILDTVHSPDEHGAEAGTGFLFHLPEAESLYSLMVRACEFRRADPNAYRRMQVRGMESDFSWDRSAADYENVYRWSVEVRQRIRPPVHPPRADPGWRDVAQGGREDYALV